MGWDRNMDGCGKFIKYSLFIVNIFTCVGGLIVFALGVWTVVDKSFANELLGTNIYAGVAYVSIVTGLFIFFISCFGCFGSIKEVRCMLVTYFIAVLLIFVTMLVGGILGYVFREKVDSTLRNEMFGSIRSYGNNRYVTRAWDEVQSRLRCCGIDSKDDWKNEIPNSCCTPILGRQQNCVASVEVHNSFTLYQRGCYGVTKEFVKSHAQVVGTAAIVVSCLMILGMIFSCTLFKLID